MDEITPVLTPPQSGALKKARHRAACALERDTLLSLILTYLFCGTVLFALFFAEELLSFFLMPQTLMGLVILMFLKIALAVLCFICLLLPLFAGRLRMTGLCAAGKRVALEDLFYYFGSLRLWGRGMWIALICPLALLPALFSLPALAAGNDTLSMSRAARLSAGRIPLADVLGFWGRLLVRFLLGLLTLGLLWLMYDAHHAPVSYFALVMQKQTAENA